MSETIDQKRRVLIVDDESAIRDLLLQMLADEYACVTSDSAEAALEEITTASFDLVISDVNLGGMTGVEMVPRIQSTSPDTVVMMITGAPTVETAIDALRVGVFDYIRKPFDFDQVSGAVKKALMHHDSLVSKRRHESDLATLVEQKSAELEHLASHDPLTGLPNKSLFEQQLNHLVTSEIDPAGEVAILLIGLSNLRAIRDSLGHAAANLVLLELSRRLTEFLRDDSLARSDGDVFALLVRDADPARVAEMANGIFEILKPVVFIDTQEIHARGNIGISFFPTDGGDYQSLVRNAGAALSQAESNAPGTFQFYAPEMNARAVRQLELENGLRRALERNELAVFYQSKLDVRSGEIIGMEALLRWNSSALGPISPGVFIPVAESTGLIVPIGEWALQTACAQAKLLHDEGFPLQLAVNLSGRQLQDKGLSESVCNILADTGFDPPFLNLEVTESAVIENPTAATEALVKFQKLGINISIDDFGTGHCSFAYLRSLPVDVLKIDKSFIDNIAVSEDAATLVKTMITMAHELRFTVVAEGVETEDQLMTLSLLGCDQWQGFLHSRPLPVGEFRETLNTK